MIDEITKTFYNPGDLCVVRHEDMHSPVMLVTEKVTKVYKKDDAVVTDFVGIKCRWFDKNNCLQEAIFSTKDLKHYK